MQIAYKGGMAPLAVNTWLVTTNAPPEYTYSTDPSGAFMRRIVDFAWVVQLTHDGAYIMSSPKFHDSPLPPFANINH